MNRRNIHTFSRKILLCCIAFIGFLNVGNSHAAFPFDLNSGVVFTEVNVPGLASFMASMEETATLEAGISGGTVFLRSDRTNIWPRSSGQNGAGDLSCCNANAWAFIQVDGVWHGATWEFLRVGSTTRDLSALRGPGHLRFAPLGNYVARTGDVVGFMVAGITRNRLSFNNIRERSNIVFVRIGGGVVDPSELGFFPEGEEPVDASNSVGPGVLNLLLDN